MRISDWSSDVCSSDLRIAFCEGRYLCIIGQAEYAARHVRIELGTIENEAFITAIHPDQVNAASRGKLRFAPISACIAAEHLDPVGTPTEYVVNALLLFATPDRKTVVSGQRMA